jgi:hypothetical protein
MDFTDALKELADIHMPGEVSWWPLAAGWWFVIAVVLALLAFGAWRMYQRQLLRRRVNAALAEVSRARKELESADTNNMARRLVFVNEVNAVLRRVALLHDDPNQVAGLSGKAWVNYLSKYDKAGLLNQQLANALAQGRFAPSCDVDASALEQMAREWIKNRYMARIEPETKSENNAAAEQHA